ncbi:hypothetical protein EBZ37_09235 [bacterium]|nr:hypothetical protein [bacterium]
MRQEESGRLREIKGLAICCSGLVGTVEMALFVGYLGAKSVDGLQCGLLQVDRPIEAIDREDKRENIF